MSTTDPKSDTTNSPLQNLRNGLDGKQGYECFGGLAPVLETPEANACMNQAIARARQEAGANGSTSIELLFFPDGTGCAVRANDPDEVVVAVLTAEEALQIAGIIEGKADKSEVSP